MWSRYSKSLKGVTLIGPDFRGQAMKRGMRGDLDPRFEAYLEICRRTEKLANRLGAHVLTLPRHDVEGFAQHLNDPKTFTFGEMSGGVMVAADSRLRALNGASGVRRPETKLVANCDEGDLHQFPYVFANNAANQGVGKYLIEHPRQADAILRARDDHSVVSSKDYEIREYIPTPTGRHTSVRVNTSPVGEPIAAGVIYSGHNKDTGRVITAAPIHYDPMPGKHSEVDSFFGVTPENLFENPNSEYFLAARDPRSNMSQGGGCIPILGGNKRRLTYDETRMLEEMHIDSRASVLPGDIEQQLSATANAVDRSVGLATGDDFILHGGNGLYYYLETNACPGLDTYRACWAAGEAIDDATAGSGLDALALDSIARWVGK